MITLIPQIAILGKPTPIVTFRESYGDPTNRTTHNHNNVDIGAAASDRLVVVAPGLDLFVTGITCNGVAMNHVVDGVYVGFWTLLVPTGTEADFSVSQSSAPQVLNVWTVERLISPAAVYDSAMDDGGYISTMTFDADLDTVARGVVFASSVASQSSGTPTITLSGVTAVPPNLIGSTRMSAGSFVTTAAETPRAVSAFVDSGGSAPGALAELVTLSLR